MAKYAINSKGSAAFKQLATDLGTISKEIDDAVTSLTTTVTGLGDSLGIYEDEINTLVTGVKTTKEASDDSVSTLISYANSKSEKIAALVAQGLAN